MFQYSAHSQFQLITQENSLGKHKKVDVHIPTDTEPRTQSQRRATPMYATPTSTMTFFMGLFTALALIVNVFYELYQILLLGLKIAQFLISIFIPGFNLFLNVLI